MGERIVPMRTTAGGRTALTGAFAGAARRYWLGVFPRVCAERRRREARAQEIPDPLLRRVVVDALHKWGNIEGATAFAGRPTSLLRRAAARLAMGALSGGGARQSPRRVDRVALRRRLYPEANWAASSAPRRRHSSAFGVHAETLDDCVADHHSHADMGHLAETVDDCRAALAESLSDAAAVFAACLPCGG